MRLWTFHPKYLDSKVSWLFGVKLLAQSILKGQTKHTHDIRSHTIPAIATPIRVLRHTTNVHAKGVVAGSNSTLIRWHGVDMWNVWVVMRGQINTNGIISWRNY